MSDLRVVEEKSYPAELHIRISYSADYCIASLYDGDDLISYSVGFESVETAGSWEQAREKVIDGAKQRAEIIRKYGPPPKNEVVALEDGGN